MLRYLAKKIACRVISLSKTLDGLKTEMQGEPERSLECILCSIIFFATMGEIPFGLSIFLNFSYLLHLSVAPMPPTAAVPYSDSGGLLSKGTDAATAILKLYLNLTSGSPSFFLNRSTFVTKNLTGCASALLNRVSF